MSGAQRRAGVAMALVGAAVTTGLLALFASAATSVTWVAWFALVPWLFTQDRLKSWGGTLGTGVLLSVGFCVALFQWFPDSIQGFSELPRWVCWVVHVGLAPVLEPQFVTFALARRLARGFPGGRWTRARVALTGGLVYVGTEWLLPKLFADTLGHAFYNSTFLRQGADVAGAHGLTLMILLANECVLAAVERLAVGGPSRVRRALVPVALFAALVGTCFGYGALRYRQVRGQPRTGEDLVVGMVQANITKYDRLATQIGQYQVVRNVLDTHYAISDALLRDAPVDLLIWPETVYPTTFGSPKTDAGEELDDEISAFVTQRHVPLVFGAYDVENAREFNAAFFLGADPKALPRFSAYRKVKLFPLTEWVPESMDSPALRRLLPWAGSWVPGPGPRTIPLPIQGGRSVRLAPLICYEAIFPGHVAEEARQGAELIVTLSNDSWFSGSAGPRYHLMVAAFRSVETRLPQVRTANSGISAYVDPTGEIISETRMDERAGLSVRVPRTAHVGTLMVAWGDWLGPVALAVSSALLAFSAASARRGKQTRAA